MSQTVCKTKKFYDTEFEADRAAAIAEYNLKQGFKSYRCVQGKHYHICHSDPQQWSKRCPHCKQLTGYGKVHKCKVVPNGK